MSVNQVAGIIYHQLGGESFARKIGAHSFSVAEGGLSFKVPEDETKDHGNGGTAVVHIKLDPSDTYIVRGLRLDKTDGWKLVETFRTEGIYHDVLAEVVERHVGSTVEAKTPARRFVTPGFGL